MSNELRSAFQNLANEIRSKTGTSGTMSPVQMPSIIATMSLGGKKYEVPIDRLLGDVDENGVLGFPSVKMWEFNSSEILGLDYDALWERFTDSTWDGGYVRCGPLKWPKRFILPNLTTVNHGGMMNVCANDPYLEQIDIHSLSTFLDSEGCMGAFAYCPRIEYADLRGIRTLNMSQVLDRIFLGCDNLKEIDISNLTSIVEGGYWALAWFAHECPSLEIVRLNKLSSIFNSNGSPPLSGAFQGCTNLKVVDFSDATAVPYLEIPSEDHDPFSNTNNYFKIVVPDALYSQWISAEGWSQTGIVEHIVKYSDTVECLKFVAQEANSTVAMQKIGSAPDVSLEYSTDGKTWTDFVVGTTTVTLANVGDKMFLRAKTTNSTMASSSSAYNQFVMTGKIAASGSIMYLLRKDGDHTAITNDWHFNQLFQNCTALTSAPELPATTLANNCYQHMFDGCSSLVTPPSELPALSVPRVAYGDMFAGTAITKSPYIRATTISTQWGMASMFKNCSSLKEIKMDYTGFFGGYGFQTWVDGVSSTGTFYYSGSDPTRGTDAIPNGWNWVGGNYLTIRARTSGVIVGSARVGSPDQKVLEYSTDYGTTWNTFTLGSTTVTLANAGDMMMLRGTNSTIAKTWQNYWKLTFSADVDVLGNLNSLLGGSEETLTGSFYGLFDEQTHLIDASELVLPWNTLNSVSSSTAAVEAMFRNCTNLISAPELPATNLDNYCYKSMFNGCSSLVEGPKTLPALNVPQEAYNGMFNGCTSLKRTPDIKVVTANANKALSRMFFGCSSLVDVRINDFETALRDECFSHVFHNCTSLREVRLPKLTTVGSGNYVMTECFNGCTNLRKVYLPSLSNVSGYRTMRMCFCNCPHLLQVDMGKLKQFVNNQTFDNLFTNDTMLNVVDFSKATIVPGLSNTNAFSNANHNSLIVVPDALYDQWVVATNWSIYAGRIMKVSDYQAV